MSTVDQPAEETNAVAGRHRFRFTLGGMLAAMVIVACILGISTSDWGYDYWHRSVLGVSPDGRLLMISHLDGWSWPGEMTAEWTNEELLVIDTATGKVISSRRAFIGHTSRTSWCERCVRFSKDGRVVGIIDGVNRAQIITLDAMHAISGTYVSTEYPVFGLAIPPEAGSALLVAAMDWLEWDWTGGTKRIPPSSSNRVRMLDVTEDGAHWIVAESHDVLIVDRSSGTSSPLFGTRTIQSTSRIPHSSLLAVSTDKELLIVDVEQRDPPRELVPHSAVHLCASANGEFLAFRDYHMAQKICGVRDGKLIAVDYGQQPTGRVPSNPANIVATEWDAVVSIWDGSTGELLFTHHLPSRARPSLWSMVLVSIVVLAVFRSCPKTDRSRWQRVAN